MTPCTALFLLGLLVSTPAPTSAEGLHHLAVAAGKLFFGTATDTTLFNDTSYMGIVNNSNEFGLLVPENSQKWQPTEPTQGNFLFENPDRVFRLARSNRQLYRCHTLTWFSQLPDFVKATQWTRESLTAAIVSHVSHVVGHYAGRCYSWDVVNEALNDNGTFRESVFFQVLGPDFITVSFRAAAAADSHAKLYYNDFGLEFNANKTDAAVGIVRIVQDAGLRIDGVGLQAHMTVGATPAMADLVAVLSRFTTLGVEVALTELDIRHTSLPPSVAGIEQQAKDYASMVGACLAVAKCVGIVVWEFTDKYSWIPNTFPGSGDACLYDANLVKKPAYTRVSSLLAAAATARQLGASNSTKGYPSSTSGMLENSSFPVLSKATKHPGGLSLFYVIQVTLMLAVV